MYIYTGKIHSCVLISGLQQSGVLLKYYITEFNSLFMFMQNIK